MGQGGTCPAVPLSPASAHAVGHEDPGPPERVPPGFMLSAAGHLSPEVTDT